MLHIDKDVANRLKHVNSRPVDLKERRTKESVSSLYNRVEKGQLIEAMLH